MTSRNNRHADSGSGSDAGSDSSSEEDLDIVASLCQTFATGDVPSIVHSLLSLRRDLQRDAPDTVYLFFQDTLPEVWSSVARPYELLLQLLNQPELLRRPGDKVDLLVLLIRSLRKRAPRASLGVGEDEEEEAPAESNGEAAPTRPAELTEELIARAKALCLRGTYLSPRSFESLVQVYHIELTEEELLSYAHAAFAAGQYRDCCEFLKTFHLESDAFPHRLLMQHLVTDKQYMDSYAAYLSQSPSFLQRHVHAALTHMAEFTLPGDVVTPSQPPRGGNDANLAGKLALKFGFPLAEFPRLVHLKLADSLWWITRINQAADFGLLLCGEDRALQKKLLKELMRSHNLLDQILACSFLERWSYFLEPPQTTSTTTVAAPASALSPSASTSSSDSTTDAVSLVSVSAPPKPPQESHFDFFERMKPVWQQEKATWIDADGKFMLDLQKAIRLDSELPESEKDPSSLLLPALPVMEGQLPQLFLRPSAIVMVDSLASLAEARAHLRAPSCNMVGIDLEHLPENLEGLFVRPTLCQLLQISCATKVFLFDLQALRQTSLTAPSAEAFAASIAANERPNLLFPPLPPYTTLTSPTSAELIQGISDLLLELFLDFEVLKVGIGFAQDLRKLRKDFGTDLICFQVTIQGYVDLTPLLKLVRDPDYESREKSKREAAAGRKQQSAARKAMVKALKTGTPSPSPPPLVEAVDPRAAAGYRHVAKKEGGLLKLVRMVLRRSLDKTEQISNWSKRPLSVPQQQYAALDAMACLLVLQEIQRRGVIDLEAENIEATNV